MLGKLGTGSLVLDLLRLDSVPNLKDRVSRLVNLSENVMVEFLHLVVLSVRVHWIIIARVASEPLPENVVSPKVLVILESDALIGEDARLQGDAVPPLLMEEVWAVPFPL